MSERLCQLVGREIWDRLFQERIIEYNPIYEKEYALPENIKNDCLALYKKGFFDFLRGNSYMLYRQKAFKIASERVADECFWKEAKVLKRIHALAYVSKRCDYCTMCPTFIFNERYDFYASRSGQRHREQFREIALNNFTYFYKLFYGKDRVPGEQDEVDSDNEDFYLFWTAYHHFSDSSFFVKMDKICRRIISNYITQVHARDDSTPQNTGVTNDNENQADL